MIEDRLKKVWVKDQGFSLLELTIVLAVIGTISGMVLPILSQQMRQSKTSATYIRQEEICRSLAIYFLYNNCLPCPADPSANTNDQEGKALPECHGVQCIGTLPYVTLGLPESYSKDGYGHLMTYAVDSSLTIDTSTKEIPMSSRLLNPRDTKTPKQTMPPPSQTSPDSFKINILDAQRNSLLLAEKDRIAFVLVSHGQRGWGAYSKSLHERLLMEQTSNAEQENSNLSDTFIDQPFSLQERNLFRHHLKWVSLNNFMAIYVRAL